MILPDVMPAFVFEKVTIFEFCGMLLRTFKARQRILVTIAEESFHSGADLFGWPRVAWATKEDCCCDAFQTVVWPLPAVYLVQYLCSCGCALRVPNDNIRRPFHLFVNEFGDSFPRIFELFR